METGLEATIEGVLVVLLLSNNMAATADSSGMIVIRERIGHKPLMALSLAAAEDLCNTLEAATAQARAKLKAQT